MREDQIDQAEREAVLENDRLVREAEQRRASTYHAHAVAGAADIHGGRFGAAQGPPHVIGSTPTVASQYPAASAAHQTELPPEPSLGYSIDAMPELEPSAVPVSVEATGGADGAPSLSCLSPDVEPAAPPSSQKDQDNG